MLHSCSFIRLQVCTFFSARVETSHPRLKNLAVNVGMTSGSLRMLCSVEPVRVSLRLSLVFHDLCAVIRRYPLILRRSVRHLPRVGFPRRAPSSEWVELGVSGRACAFECTHACVTIPCCRFRQARFVSFRSCSLFLVVSWRSRCLF